jgi:hypothetical protein
MLRYVDSVTLLFWSGLNAMVIENSEEGV